MAQITLIIPDDLLSTHKRHGEKWVEGYVIEKLKELEIRFWEQDAQTEYEKIKPRPNRRDEV